MNTEENEMDKVLVTTQHLGVFAGEMAAQEGANIVLKNARNCAHVSGVNNGFELAIDGPGPLCSVGPKLSEIGLLGVTSITLMTDAAWAKWEKASQ